MNRLKQFLPFSALRLMYQSLVNCHLQFCILAWGYEYNRVYNPQKKALRIMTASKYNAHTEPLFNQLNIMKLEDSYSLQCLNFYHKFNTNSLPKYFANIFTRNSEITLTAHGAEIRCIIFLLKRQAPANVSDIRYPICWLRSFLMYSANSRLLVWKVSVPSIRHLLSVHMIQFVMFVIVISVKINRNYPSLLIIIGHDMGITAITEGLEWIGTILSARRNIWKSTADTQSIFWIWLVFF